MKKTIPATKNDRKLKLNRETIQSLEERGLAQVAGGESHFCHSGVSISFCC